jgi:phosphoenolpyruvate carboxykinase (GTP)
MVDDKGNKVFGAHPNSRFTAPISQCPCVSNRLEHHHGVKIDAIVFGGRRASLAPLVYESFDWEHGVFVGATMASERTAAQFGKQGEVRRDPMAMLPFCGYNLGMYFQHWLEMGKKMAKPPKIFNVNWFKLDKNGKFLWPGFGENLRVLEWIMDRCSNQVDAQETPIGYVPKPESLDLTGIEIPSATLEQLFHIDKNDWIEETDTIEEFFSIYKSALPKEMKKQLQSLKKRLAKG